MDEKTRITSIKAFSGAERARSTRLYAIAASTVGSAERSLCRSIEIVSRVTFVEKLAIDGESKECRILLPS